MITGKEAFISRISGCLGRTEPPRKPTELVYPHDMQHDYLAGAATKTLLDTFIANARGAGIEVRQCSADELAATLTRIVENAGTPVILADDPLLTGKPAQLIRDECGQCDVWDMNTGRVENMARAEQAKVGIAVAEMAMAESATTLLFCQMGHGRSVSLLPENSVIILRAETIRPRLTQAMEWLQQQTTLASSINFVSGPSSTADIELVRVQGVHGPLALTYVIVE